MGDLCDLSYRRSLATIHCTTVSHASSLPKAFPTTRSHCTNHRTAGKTEACSRLAKLQSGYSALAKLTPRWQTSASHVSNVYPTPCTYSSVRRICLSCQQRLPDAVHLFSCPAQARSTYPASLSLMKSSASEVDYNNIHLLLCKYNVI